MISLKQTIKKFSPSLVSLLLITVLFKQLVFAALVPIWHTPDEQAHFAQVAYFAEKNQMPKDSFDLNKEILVSEQLLGTERDEQGNNKFTFHPEYRIEYTDNLMGKYEQVIKDLPVTYRREMVKYEAANYPPLYYWLSAIPYKIFYHTDLINRLYLSRLVSIFISLGMVYITWLISRLIFPKDKLLQITLLIFINFQPMLTFVSIGVTSDNLMNLLFSVLIYQSLLILKNGVYIRYTLLLILNILLLFLTKPQFILGLPIICLSFLLAFFISHKYTSKFKFISGLFGILLIVLAYLIFTNRELLNLIEYIYPQSFYPGIEQNEINFISFLRDTLRHTYAEVIPWYWGVFNWLGVTYPRGVHRIINWLMVFAALSFLVKLFVLIKDKKRQSVEMLFLSLTILIYFLGITYYNYLFTKTHGFPFGIQGRYYFPVIVPQLIILLFGLVSLIPNRLRVIKTLWIKILGLGMIVLNFIAVYIIAGSYYQMNNFNKFIIQASQYKPDIFKGYSLVFILFLYLVFVIYFIIKYLTLKYPKQDEM